MSFIPWWVHYPNVNDEILNLDWLLKVSNCNTHKIENFINLNTIKYADPILWNITSQYEANTVVVDGQTGNAYISTKAVPSGVHLNRTEYWIQIYNYAAALRDLRSQIAFDEGNTTTATRPYAVEDLLFINEELFRAIAPMIAGDSFVVDSNVVKTTVEAELKRLWDATNDLSSDLSDETDARIAADGLLQDNIDIISIYELPAYHDAVGDGVADDTDAIQATIDAAIANGKTVFLNGNYKVTNLTIDSAVKIIGGGTNYLTVSGSIIINYFQASSLITKLNVQGTNASDFLFKIYAQNVTITDCTLRSEGGVILDYGALNKFTNNQIVCNALQAFKFDVDNDHININCVVSNNIIGGSGSLLFVTSNDATKRPEGLLFAQNNSICSAEKCIIVNAAFHLTIINNTLDMIGRHVLFFNPTQTVESVIFSDNYVGITSDEYFAIGAVSPSNEIWDLTICNNNVFGASCLAFMPSLFRSVIIDGNNFSNNNLYYAGVYAHGTAYLRIINNRIQKTGTNATAFDCDGATGNHLIIANNIYSGLKTITNYDSNHLTDEGNLIG